MAPEELIFKGSTLKPGAQYEAFNIDKHEGENEKNKPEYQSFMCILGVQLSFTKKKSISFRLGNSFT